VALHGDSGPDDFDDADCSEHSGSLTTCRDDGGADHANLGHVTTVNACKLMVSTVTTREPSRAPDSQKDERSYPLSMTGVHVGAVQSETFLSLCAHARRTGERR
jgi:hypothetical protein